jgi:hypothetical protein
MTSHGMDALVSLERAKERAQLGEFEDAWDDWTDVCRSMIGAREWGEPLGADSEYEKAVAKAQALLDEYGDKMAAAHVDGQREEAVERERERLRSLVKQIQDIAAR